MTWVISLKKKCSAYTLGGQHRTHAGARVGEAGKLTSEDGDLSGGEPGEGERRLLDGRRRSGGGGGEQEEEHR